MSLVVLKDILMKVSDELLGFDGGEVIWDLGNTLEIVGTYFSTYQQKNIYIYIYDHDIWNTVPYHVYRNDVTMCVYRHKQ